MNRQHFIRLTTAALGGLVFSKWSVATPMPGEAVDAVFVLLDDGEHLLTSKGGGLFIYKETAVQLTSTGTGLAVTVRSPGQALHHIRLHWDLPRQPPAAILGDHWERTYGDVGFHPVSFAKKMPWYFIAHDDSITLCMGIKTGASSIAHWQVGADKVQLTLDTRSGGVGVQLGDRMLKAAEILNTFGQEGENVFATGRRFCGLLCEKPRLSRQPVYGINDWYAAYGNNNPALILAQTALMTDLAQDTNNRPFSLIDAGWAFYSPLQPDSGGWMDDFSRPNAKFPDMAKLADDIRKLGMRPAIWTRPLCASYKDPKTLLLPPIPGRDDPKSPVLDPTIGENLARVQRNISLYRQWGYEMVKHDFTTYDILGKWGFQMTDDITTPGWRFYDNGRTTAEIMLDLYRGIREAAGEESYIIGCNTMSHLSAGIFELNRIGDDTSGKEWDRTRKMGVNTLGFRMIQHDKFYAADGDCVGLTSDVPWEKNKQWMQLVAGSGSPLFISTQPDVIGADQRQIIRESFTRAARKQAPGEPLDWLENTLPKKWKLDGEVKMFDWG